MATGVLQRGPNPRSYVVEVPRPARVKSLVRNLKQWEAHGFLKWEQIQQPPIDG